MQSSPALPSATSDPSIYRFSTRLACCLLLVNALAGPMSGETLSYSQLNQRVTQSGSTAYWLSYEIDSNANAFICCWSGAVAHRGRQMRPSACRPDGKSRGWSTWQDDDTDDGDRLRILLRLRDGEVERVRAFSPSCPLDFENRVEEVDVTTSDSLAFFARLADAEAKSASEDRLGRIHGPLGYHADPAADRVLAALAGDRSSSRDSRHSAIFWLGQTRGAFAVEALRRLLDDETDKDLKEHIVFSISQTQTPDNQGTTELIRLIEETRDPAVRRRAVFWLGTSKDPRALDLLSEVLRAD